MPSDPIQHLRELLAKATPGPCLRRTRSVYRGGKCWYEDDRTDREHEDMDLIVAAVNSLPALLDVAEAARQVERNDRISVVWEDHLIAFSMLRNALAKLDKKP